LPEHEKATLSAASWVKRRWRRLDRDPDGFPSTASIASAPFRKAVLDHLDDQHVLRAVSALTQAAQRVIQAASAGRDVREARVRGLPDPGGEPGKWFASTGGPWVYPDQWQLESLAREMKVDAAGIASAASDGLAAAKSLHELMKQRKAAPLASYLAVLAADLDGMGRFLAGQAPSADGKLIDASPGTHQCVSRAIQNLASRQRDLLRASDLLGVPVYAGGDDLLAFVPAADVANPLSFELKVVGGVVGFMGIGWWLALRPRSRVEAAV